MVWSGAPLQIHSSSAFTYTSNELNIPHTEVIPKTRRTLENIPFFQLFFP